jgi:hypothetical protein
LGTPLPLLLFPLLFPLEVLLALELTEAVTAAAGSKDFTDFDSSVVLDVEEVS